MWWFIGPKLVFGEDALQALAELEGKKAFIVSDPELRRLGYIDRVSNLLVQAGFQVNCFDSVEEEPSIENVVEGARLMSNSSPDWIVALGGGSSIDAAKAMWVLYERPDLSLYDITPFTKLGLRKKARLVAIPTTSGTGSDSTWAVVITDKEGKRKVELASREVVPDIAILDPSLPQSMPPRLTAHTGLDALTHAVEAYTCQWRNDFSDAVALKAISLIFRYLPRSYSDGNDAEAREKMHLAATMAGLAFSNSQIGMAHALGHALGAVFKIPHGLTVGMSLPYVIQFSWRQAEDRYCDIARVIGLKNEGVEILINILIEALKGLIRSIGQPLSLSELGIPKEDFNYNINLLVKRANESTGTIVNPRIPTDEDFRRVFECIYSGSNVTF